MKLAVGLNSSSELEVRRVLERCCAASRWVAGMVRARPFADDAAVFRAADVLWSEMEREDILEAFSAHPRIGSTRAAPKGAMDLSAQEQRGVANASTALLERLQQRNADYEARYGHIFIVFASGRTVEQMLELLEGRMRNTPDSELKIAAEAQRKITRRRLELAFAQGTDPDA